MYWCGGNPHFNTERRTSIMKALIIEAVVKFIKALILDLAVNGAMDYLNEILSYLNGILF